MEMIMTGEPISARRALELGLVNRVVPPDELIDAAVALAEQICANAPLSVQASKRIACGIIDGRIPAEDDAWALSAAEGKKLHAERRLQGGAARVRREAGAPLAGPLNPGGRSQP